MVHCQHKMRGMFVVQLCSAVESLIPALLLVASVTRKKKLTEKNYLLQRSKI